MNWLRFAPALAAILSVAAHAVDVETLAADCDACHGPLGASVDSDVPIIGGQSVNSIEKALTQFAEWSRPCNSSAYRHGDTQRPPRNMCQVAEELSSEEIESLARHYGDQEWVPAEQPFDSEKATAGAAIYSLYCVTCHPKGGNEAGYAVRLAGQWTPYLALMMQQIVSGEWLVPKIMQRKMSSFSAEEIEALLNYFASQKD